VTAKVGVELEGGRTMAEGSPCSLAEMEFSNNDFTRAMAATKVGALVVAQEDGSNTEVKVEDRLML
jgi:hypothetical protein